MAALLAVIGAAMLAASASAASNTAGLAYTTGSGTGPLSVWVSTANGTQGRRLARGEAPVLSPSGKLVAFGSFGASSQALLIYSASGKLVKRLPGGATPLAWSPDSRYLAIDNHGPVIIDLKTMKTKRLARGVLHGASFAPGGSGRLVYGLSKTLLLSSAVNLYTVGANGRHRKRLTRDGRSANPVWGKLGIAFDRITPRGMNAPEYQIYLLSGGKAKQITDSPSPALVDGLVPLAVSADGAHLVAGYEGEDTDEAYTVDLKTRALHRLTHGSTYVTPWGISRNGKRVLVDLGGFEGPPSGADVATIPFGGGSATVLVKHAGAPSWNQ